MQGDLREVFAAAVDLALREREKVHDVDATSQRLRSSGKRVEAGGPGDQESPWSQTAVELGLDGVEHYWHLLEFVDANRRDT